MTSNDKYQQENVAKIGADKRPVKSLYYLGNFRQKPGQNQDFSKTSERERK